MRLIINGEERDVRAGTVQELLEELQVEPGRVAVELNLQVIRRADFRTRRLTEGDAVEIVNFVGGGDRDDGRGFPFAHTRSFRPPRFLPLLVEDNERMDYRQKKPRNGNPRPSRLINR